MLIVKKEEIQWLKANKFPLGLILFLLPSTFLAKLWLESKPSILGIILTMVLGTLAISLFIYLTCKTVNMSKFRFALGLAPLLCGILSNTIVMVVNNGYMPILALTTQVSPYISFEGAKLLWLADWIFGNTSPGDILIYLGTLIYLSFLWLGILTQQVEKKQ